MVLKYQMIARIFNNSQDGSTYATLRPIIASVVGDGDVADVILLYTLCREETIANLCRLRDYNALSYLLRSGMNVRNNASALMDAAIGGGRLDLVKYLLDEKIIELDPEFTEDDPLVRAAEYGQLKLVQYLHELGNTIDAWALYHAASKGRVNVVKYLIPYVMDPFMRLCSLEKAIKRDHQSVVECLMEGSPSLDLMLLAVQEDSIRSFMYMLPRYTGPITPILNRAYLCEDAIIIREYVRNR
jgi:hypothetical protein